MRRIYDKKHEKAKKKREMEPQDAVAGQHRAGVFDADHRDELAAGGRDVDDVAMDPGGGRLNGKSKRSDVRPDRRGSQDGRRR